MTRVLVVGDVLLDRDVLGHVERICPDAPVPVLDQDRTVERPGGAGLAAVLAGRHGVEVDLLCALAPDDGGHLLRELLDAAGVRVLDCGTGGSTVEKVRVRAGGQSLVRIDRGDGADLGALSEDATARALDADVVLVADYGRGVSAHEPVRALLSAARRAGTPVVWDPHPKGADPVPDVTLVTPNRREAAGFSEQEDGGAETLAADVRRARQLRGRWSSAAVAVTLGESGALLVTGDGAPLVVPVEQPVPAADTCGAGDAFAAAVAVALGRGAVLSEAVQEGVRAASGFVADSRSDEDASATQPAGAGGGGRSGTLIATGGCFDLLHPGHVSTLERARRLGDRLVVLLNSDASVRRLKGPSRPVQDEHDRAAVLRSLACVDDVVVFDEDTPVEALRRLRPDVFVKGGDYSSAELPEATVLSEWGGTVVTVPFLAGRSTTGLLQRIDGNGVAHVG
jgi:D-beta-D-heptose 7-phosphate kinase/D-beta-D-heptose 1-phosphate adenosyltransferase